MHPSPSLSNRENASRISEATRMRWIHSCLSVYRTANTVLTVYCLTPEMLHSLRGEETTHMNSRIIITAGLGVPSSTGPSTILFDVWFLL